MRNVDRLPRPSDPGFGDAGPTSRQRQRRTRGEIADEIGIDKQGVGAVDRLEGLDVFLRSGGAREFGEQVRSDFASSADFVTPADVAPRVDGQDISANPMVADDRRDDVASRTRSQLAADDPFAMPGDFGV